MGDTKMNLYAERTAVGNRGDGVGERAGGGW